jgi:Transglutaminase-like superfamily
MRIRVSNHAQDQIAADGCRPMPTRIAYFLSENSYCCEFDDGAIILELGTGTYVGVHAESLPELRSRTKNWPNSSDIDRGAPFTGGATSENLIAHLLARGILTTSPTPERSFATITAREALSITGSEAARKRWPIIQIPRFVNSLLTVATHHKDKKLASLLDWLRRRQSSIRAQGHSVTIDDVRKLLVTFLRLRIWFYTADRRCLFDSLVLATFLTKKKIPCTFVIGVSTKPFLAHSWVQVGTSVLNDTAEHVQMFTPILVIDENSWPIKCSATL